MMARHDLPAILSALVEMDEVAKGALKDYLEEEKADPRLLELVDALLPLGWPSFVPFPRHGKITKVWKGVPVWVREDCEASVVALFYKDVVWRVPLKEVGLAVKAPDLLRANARLMARCGWAEESRLISDPLDCLACPLCFTNKVNPTKRALLYRCEVCLWTFEVEDWEEDEGPLQYGDEPYCYNCGAHYPDQCLCPLDLDEEFP